MLFVLRVHTIHHKVLPQNRKTLTTTTLLVNFCSHFLVINILHILSFVKSVHTINPDFCQPVTSTCPPSCCHLPPLQKPWTQLTLQTTGPFHTSFFNRRYSGSPSFTFDTVYHTMFLKCVFNILQTTGQALQWFKSNLSDRTVLCLPDYRKHLPTSRNHQQFFLNLEVYIYKPHWAIHR